MSLETILLAGVLLAGTAVSASAELVFLKTGRSLSVKAVRYDGDAAVLALRTGGEIVCSRTAIDRVEADEVAYPEPPAPVADASAAEASAAAAPAVRRLAAVDVPAEYRALIGSLARAHGVDPSLVHAVVAVESAWQPRARPLPIAPAG